MTITGLVSTATLSFIGLVGIALTGGGGSSAAASVVEVGAAGLLIAGVALVTRHPELLISVAHSAMRLINRFRRRPAETGVARLTGLAEDLRAIRPGARDWAKTITLAFLNWLLDLGCLAACCAAMDLHVSLSALLLTYTAGMAATSLSPLPAGIGAVEAAMALGLALAGATGSAALAVVLLYRLISVGSIVGIGWTIVALQRKRPAPVPDHRSLAAHPAAQPAVDRQPRSIV